MHEDICAENEDGTIECKCPWRFACDSSINCKEVDPCASSLCSQNARCAFIDIGKYICTFLIGSELIGNIWEEKNLCQENNRGCHWRHEFVDTLGLDRKCANVMWDMNGTNTNQMWHDWPLNWNECHPMAIYTREMVIETICQCKEGCVGDGRKECFENLIQIILQLNLCDISLQGLLGKFLMFISSIYNDDLYFDTHLLIMSIVQLTISS